MNVKSTLKRLLFQVAPYGFTKSVLKAYYFKRIKSYQKNGGWESNERDMDIVKYLVASGDSVIDVGANFGFYTLFLSNLVGNQGQVSSFEPIPLTYEILSNNVKRLSLLNVKLFDYAISEQEGPGTMVIPKWSDSGGENFYQARIRSGEAASGQLQEVRVNLKSLDSLFVDHQRTVAFVKIDVEGHELQVIEGARTLISRSMPALLVEVSSNPDDRQSSAFALFNLLREEGYDAYWYDGATFKHRSSGDQSVNYFFLTRSQLVRFKAAAQGAIACAMPS